MLCGSIMTSRALHTAHVQTGCVQFLLSACQSPGVVRRDFNTETANAHVQYYIAGYVRLINSVNMLLF